MDLKFTKIIKGLHWTTVSSERVLLAIIGIATCIAAAQYLFSMFIAREITLADLFLLFIYAEIIGMVGVFYSCLLYTSPSPRDLSTSRMPSSA